MSQPFLGQLAMFAGNFAPLGWAICNGQTLAISENPALFQLLGTIYGGDGVNTFNLPDLRSRVPVHQGQGPGLSSYVIGQLAGTETVTLLTQQLPSHAHPLMAGAAADSSTPANTLLATEGGADAGAVSIYAPFDATPANMTTLLPTSVTIQGGSQPHENLQPFLAINFIIALQGIFPTQN
jgi:microcystin-dependent protein